ncbi:type II secretion system protein [Microbacterium esteraromaticum]|uniref:type II secretion system protein n=1 Tax=Microbacterium esteraromaticum TaxID=57043 RepID=UPI00195EFAA7|nr:type II secretion system protein [Microbacterium esteraromaticum]MBM7465806.1 type II secretory pathway pseudopilin PulG [Microbacterium esteraromaticum]
MTPPIDSLRRPRGPAGASDDGISLIELIVVVLIVALLGGVVTMILVNSWNTQRQVSSTTVATNEGQVVASAVEHAVRNSDGTRVSGADTLTIWTIGAGTKTCQAFKFAPADPADTAKGSAAFMTAGSGTPSWTTPPWKGPTIRQDVSPSPTYFTKDGNVITYSFQIRTEASPVVFRGEVAARNTGAGSGVSPCWP